MINSEIDKRQYIINKYVHFKYSTPPRKVRGLKVENGEAFEYDFFPGKTEKTNQTKFYCSRYCTFGDFE
ncbi:hypothetical protein GCM10007216_19800 [Thalassobacillus devorans]|uniref:Uncharacterized protein n=1 Tax=Thalassobacillus devorans TaxID=279813 RepID=A0ABQ1P1F5_9BACI|nr:hypothetical protein GCM10007216_19800 [Thalassobacillus devorans]